MMTRPRLSGAKPDSTKACVPIVRNAERGVRSEEHTSELQSQSNLVCRLLLEKKKNIPTIRGRWNLLSPLSLPRGSNGTLAARMTSIQLSLEHCRIRHALGPTYGYGCDACTIS